MTVCTKKPKKEKSKGSNEFELIHLIEFSGDQIKLEKAKYQSSKKIEVINVCMAYHGGPLDHPKVTSKSIGDVVTKWDLCYEKLLAGDHNPMLEKADSTEEQTNSKDEAKNEDNEAEKGTKVDDPNKGIY